MERVELLVIDLDDTLCDTYHTLSTPQRQKVERLLAGTPLEEGIKRRGWAGGFDATLREVGATAEKIAELRTVYDDLSVAPLKLHPDAPAILYMKIPKVLLTRSDPELQRRKIAQLGIREFFQDIVFVPTTGSKLDETRALLEKRGVAPNHAGMIGDRADDEIAAGNELGMHTILVLRRGVPPLKSGVEPEFEVTSLTEAAELLGRQV